MRFEVKKGIVKWKGVFLRKGSFFDAEKHEVQGLLISGVISQAERESCDSDGGTGEGELISNPHPPDMTVEELKKFLEHARVEEAEKVLEAEMAKPEPRKTVLKLLNDWLKHADVKPPTLDADEVVVD
jgi:hypothetical protein